MAATNVNNTVVQEAVKSAPWRRARQETQKELPPVQETVASQQGHTVISEKEASNAQQLNNKKYDAIDDDAEKGNDSEVASATDEIEKGSERSEDAERSTDPEDDGAASGGLSYCETMSNWSEHDEIEQSDDSQDVAPVEATVTAEQAALGSPTEIKRSGSSVRWADMDEDDDDFIVMRKTTEQDHKTAAEATPTAADASPTRTPLRTPLKKNASLFVPSARPDTEYQALPFLPSSAVADAWQRWHEVQEAYQNTGSSYHY